MIKIYCDRCEAEQKDILDAISGLKFTAGNEWNSSWETYGQFYFCEDCVGKDAFLQELKEKLI